MEFEGWSPRRSYRSDEDDLVRDLWDPALRGSATYLRASGFFSSSTFRALADAYEDFFSKSGLMILVCSPVVSRADAEAIGRGLVLRDAADLPEDVGELFRRLRAGRITPPDVLRHLLRYGRIRVSVCFRRGGRQSIFHEKFGMFHARDGGRLMVAGSVNESENGLTRNFERAETWRSWGSDDERQMVDLGGRQFERILAGTTDGLEVVPLFRAYADGRLLVRDADGWSPPEATGSRHRGAAAAEVLVPASVTLFPHQRAAMAAWGAAGGRGLLAMATGSGKTITALSIASKLFDGLGGSGLAVMIVAPLLHLVDQWRAEARVFGLDPVRCAEGAARWRSELDAGVATLNAGTRRVLSFATTPDTMLSAEFQEALGRLRRPLLVIGDEAHNYGAPRYAAALPAADYRMGLSATPERWLDPEGTAAVRDYFGPVVYEYGLGDAIRDGILTPYLYHPVLIDLDPGEAERYVDFSRQLARYGFVGGEEDPPAAAKRLLMARARVVAGASGKLPELRRLLARNRGATHVLVYCGDGMVDGEETMARQIDEVVRIVGVELGMSCARYTADTPSRRRKELLELFDAGTIQVLVAIRCLDEGVDVPSTRTAYILASSSNPRQFVQRRGRVLRRSPRTGKSEADVFDFFVVPPEESSGDPATDRAMRRLFAGQIGRAAEFSDLALNGPAARAPLVDVSKRLGLLEDWGR